MEWFMHIIDFFIHLDDHIGTLIQNYGGLTYLIVFLIIFCETGLVFMPFLPGDSLLFVMGIFSATGDLDLKLVLGLLFVAAILGDTVNYWVGHFLAAKVRRKEHILFVKDEHLRRTQKFYDKYGAYTIIIARFVPIIRTVAPFLAGAGSMTYPKFIFYNLLGGTIWVLLFVLMGYFFGNLPFVEKNFSLVILLIIFISIIPIVTELWRNRHEFKAGTT